MGICAGSIFYRFFGKIVNIWQRIAGVISRNEVEVELGAGLASFLFPATVLTQAKRRRPTASEE